MGSIQEDTNTKLAQPTSFRPGRCALTPPDGAAKQPQPSNMFLRGSIFSKSSRTSIFKAQSRTSLAQCRQSRCSNRLAADRKHSKICRSSSIKAQGRFSYRRPSVTYTQHLPESLAGWEKSKQAVTQAFMTTLSAGLWAGSSDGSVDLHAAHVAACRKAKEEQSEQAVQKILKERQARKTSIFRRVEAVTANDADWHCNLVEDLGPLSHRVQPRKKTPVWERLARNKPRMKLAKKSVRLSLFRANLPDLNAEQRARVDTEMQRVMATFLGVPKADPRVKAPGDIVSGASKEHTAEGGWHGVTAPPAGALNATDAASQMAAPLQRKQLTALSRKSRLGALMSRALGAKQAQKALGKGSQAKAATKQRQKGAQRGGAKPKAARRSRAVLVLSKKEVGAAVKRATFMSSALEPGQAQLGVGRQTSSRVKGQGQNDGFESAPRSSMAFKTPRRSTFAARNAERMGQLLHMGSRLDAMLAAMDAKRPAKMEDSGNKKVHECSDVDIGIDDHSNGMSTGGAAAEEEEWEEYCEGLSHEGAGKQGSSSKGSAGSEDEGGEGKEEEEEEEEEEEKEEDIFASLPPSLRPAQTIAHDQGVLEEQQREQHEQGQQQKSEEEQDHRQQQEHEQQQEHKQQQQQGQEQLQQQEQDQQQHTHVMGLNNDQMRQQKYATGQRKVPHPPSVLQRLDSKTDKSKLQSPKAAAAQKQKGTPVCPSSEEAEPGGALGAGGSAAYVDIKKKTLAGQKPEAKPVENVPTASSLESDGSKGEGTVAGLDEKGILHEQHHEHQPRLRRSFTWTCSNADPHLCEDEVDGRIGGCNEASALSLSSSGAASKNAAGAAALLLPLPYALPATKSCAVSTGFPSSPPPSTLPPILPSPRSAPHLPHVRRAGSSPGMHLKAESCSSAGARIPKIEDAASGSPSNRGPQLPSNGSRSIQAWGAPAPERGVNAAGDASSLSPNAASHQNPVFSLDAVHTNSAHSTEAAHAKGGTWHTYSATGSPRLGGSAMATGTGLLPQVYAPSSSQPTRAACWTPEAQKLRSYLYGDSSSAFQTNGMHCNALCTATSSTVKEGHACRSGASDPGKCWGGNAPLVGEGAMTCVAASAHRDGTAFEIYVAGRRGGAAFEQGKAGQRGGAAFANGAAGQRGGAACANGAAGQRGGAACANGAAWHRGGTASGNGVVAWHGGSTACESAAALNGAVDGAAAQKHGCSSEPTSSGSGGVLGYITMQSRVVSGDASPPTRRAIQVVNPRLPTPFSQRDHKHLLPHLPSSFPLSSKAQPNSSTSTSASQYPAAANGALHQGAQRGFQGAGMARMTAGFDWNNRRRRQNS
ncbi:hypothetical protein DUNSADRAFT_7974 [Dunaliella salina]|uniref:Uncharacterized protein n=1 Tax=Dunaliella salina TaxID=3046 RepID=A0ABQ7H692_DUNSA|nr:hypothetical protein DUNSADRAFT_7974 [Dunaliella salina]|eukprot:KAF5842321.1 hypothetical protein DUNSADRAFT_7974 [Dunaliella salina]